MILNDGQIKHLVQMDKLLIDPFINKQVKELNGKKCVSYGLSSFGYDFRLDKECYYIGSYDDDYTPIDVKAFDSNFCKLMEIENDDSGDYIVIPPHGFVLGKSVEIIQLPRNCQGVVWGKSTYARVGLIINVTPIESLWNGTITLELSNTTPCPVKVYINEGIGQLTIFQGEDCEVSYADRSGKYQGQVDVTFAKV
jgi:dCTP deaminase